MEQQRTAARCLKPIVIALNSDRVRTIQESKIHTKRVRERVPGGFPSPVLLHRSLVLQNRTKVPSPTINLVQVPDYMPSASSKTQIALNLRRGGGDGHALVDGGAAAGSVSVDARLAGRRGPQEGGCCPALQAAGKAVGTRAHGGFGRVRRIFHDRRTARALAAGTPLTTHNTRLEYWNGLAGRGLDLPSAPAHVARHPIHIRRFASPRAEISALPSSSPQWLPLPLTRLARSPDALSSSLSSSSSLELDTDETWYAEEAVPKTNPSGKLPRVSPPSPPCALHRPCSDTPTSSSSSSSMAMARRLLLAVLPMNTQHTGEAPPPPPPSIRVSDAQGRTQKMSRSPEGGKGVWKTLFTHCTQSGKVIIAHCNFGLTLLAPMDRMSTLYAKCLQLELSRVLNHCTEFLGYLLRLSL
ncbi:hypothetical protein U9M48_006566 [Paspalum notatum var. saurae]|uniref:Uncharacterized protein n=1 Tax=Paspalum notatum var. saurae TaxID=547442 RepID=A0AAQ3SGA8_PASNO